MAKPKYDRKSACCKSCGLRGFVDGSGVIGADISDSSDGDNEAIDVERVILFKNTNE